MWKLASKDLYLFFYDKKALALTLLLPIGLITLFAFAFGGAGGEKNEPSPITLQFTDEDQSPASKALLASLDSIPGIRLEEVADQVGTNQIKKGSRIAQLYIGNGFDKELGTGGALPVALRYDQSREMEVSILRSLIIGRIGKMQGSRQADTGVDRIIAQSFPNMPAAMVDTIKRQMQATGATETHISMSSVVGEEQSNWGLIQAVAGTAIMMLLFSVSAIGASIIEEKEQGVLKRLLQSPLSPTSILSGKLLSAGIIAVFQLVIMFLFAWLAFGLDLSINPIGTVLMILFTAVTCASFGVLLASIVSSKRQADSLGTILVLSMSGIGGSMIPLYIMPSFMQDIAVVSVNYWSIQGFYDIFWRGLGLSALLDNLLVLLGFSVVLLTLAFYFFRKNILKFD